MRDAIMIACTAWVCFYIVAGLMTAIYFSSGGSKKSMMVLFLIGLGWWIVWFCFIGGQLDAKRRK